MHAVTVPELIERLQSGSLVVLPSERAAQELRAAFDTAQIDDGRSAWQPPNVLSWEQWTRSHWSQLVLAGAETRLLLNHLQEHSLWCDILRDDAEHSSLSSVNSLADVAQQAWSLAASYGVITHLRQYAATNDCRIFAGWAEEFSRRCIVRAYLSAALLEASLIEHLDAGRLTAPRRFEVVGFAETLPAQDALLAAFQEHGSAILHYELKAGKPDPQPPALFTAENELQELAFAGQWIRTFLERETAEGRAPRIAVLVSDLAEQRTKIEDIFRRTITPEMQWIGADISSTVWEIAEGPSLASVPLIADALMLARWSAGPLPVNDVTSLLLSPYLWSSGEDTKDRDANARFDAERLRRLFMLRPEVDISTLVALIDTEVRRSISRDTQHRTPMMPWLKKLYELTRATQERPRSFAEWMEFIRRVTQAVGWPAERPMNSMEFEANRAWENLLDTIATLDFSGRAVSFAEALEELQQQAQRMRLKRAPTHAPVQVMRVREAEACVFDAVLFLHCTDRNWPESERAHPLLAWSLQERYEMPGTDSVRSAERSSAFMKRMMERCGCTVFTCAAEDERGPTQVSPLLEGLGVERLAINDRSQLTRRAERIVLEEHVELPLQPLPSVQIAGGAAVLKLQAACGFLAFAEIRLRAKDLRAVEFGLDARENGTLLHRTLQLFWQETRSQEVLRQRTADEQEQCLQAAIAAAMAERTYPRGQWEHAYIALQKEHLLALLQHWVRHELRRSPFTVLELEQKQTVNVGPLTLELRMDRVDRVDDGVVFVDYKSGYSANVKQWEGPRPDDPQLPLYALAEEAAALKALAFAKVRNGDDMRWEGVQNAEGILPKAKVRDVAMLVEEWRSTLTQLAEDFAAGMAEVDPKSFEQNCTHCMQRLLCRVNRASLEIDTNEEFEGTEFIDG